jgi:hypothetical protein
VLEFIRLSAKPRHAPIRHPATVAPPLASSYMSGPWAELQ